MEIIKEFGINPVLLAAQIVNFTILLLLLRAFLYKPILKLLEERKKRVAASLKQAEEIENKLAEISQDQEKILQKAREEAARIIAESKQEAKELAEKTMQETKETVDQMIKRSEERVQLEKEKMMALVKKDITELVIAATAKVAKKTMDEPTNKKLIDETIKELIG
jgi:F-type H+-transporting ATPase subunit b